jgi:hypothetical protein
LASPALPSISGARKGRQHLGGWGGVGSLTLATAGGGRLEGRTRNNGRRQRRGRSSRRWWGYREGQPSAPASEVVERGILGVRSAIMRIEREYQIDSYVSFLDRTTRQRRIYMFPCGGYFAAKPRSSVKRAFPAEPANPFR